MQGAACYWLSYPHCHWPVHIPYVVSLGESAIVLLIIACHSHDTGFSLLNCLRAFAQKIPMAVLYGVFLYMGVSSLNGMDFIQRCAILFMVITDHAIDSQLISCLSQRSIYELCTIIDSACFLAAKISARYSDIAARPSATRSSIHLLPSIVHCWNVVHQNDQICVHNIPTTGTL